MGTTRTLRQASQALPQSASAQRRDSNQQRNDVDHVVSTRDELKAPAQPDAPDPYDQASVNRIVRSSSEHSHEMAELLASAEHDGSTVAIRRMLLMLVASFVMLVAALVVLGFGESLHIFH